ncbi:hypothetical protein KIW84_UN0751 [Lathyrus oleraceus]|nr:hypothetical protein KIW84_UN0751 [Pisum sativum]
MKEWNINFFFDSLKQYGSSYGNSTVSGVDSNSSVGLNHGDVLVQAVNSKLNLNEFREAEFVLRKLQMCCVVFDYTDPSKNVREKEIKRQMLVELVDYVTSANSKFTDVMMQEIVKTVSVNLFRTLTTPPRENKILEPLI